MRGTPRVAILGCGNRGADVYARLLAAQGAAVTALVEPRPARLAEVAARHRLGPEHCFAHWDDFFALGRVADAVVIATPDDAHVEPCLRALALGYDVLLEKPICLDEADLARVLDAEARSAGRVTVCHVLRTTPFFQAVLRVLRSGQLGQLVGIQHAENVAWWHYAHAYVRGHWRASPPAAPFVLAKSCAPSRGRRQSRCTARGRCSISVLNTRRQEPLSAASCARWRPAPTTPGGSMRPVPRTPGRRAC